MKEIEIIVRANDSDNYMPESQNILTPINIFSGFFMNLRGNSKLAEKSANEYC